MASLDLQFDKAQFLETAERMQFCYEELLENDKQQEIMFLERLEKDGMGREGFLGGGNSNIFYFHPYLGKIPILTNIFQRG